jgi:hypothetical protein
VQQSEGNYYSEVGAWMVARRIIEQLTGRSAAEVTHELISRVGGDAALDGCRVAVDARTLIVPIAGLPDRYLPMLHNRRSAYLDRLGFEFGGVGTMSGYLSFLREVDAAWNGQPSLIDVRPEVIHAIRLHRREVSQDEVWRRPAGFVAGFTLGATESTLQEAAELLMAFGGVTSNSVAVLDPARHIAWAVLAELLT